MVGWIAPNSFASFNAPVFSHDDDDESESAVHDPVKRSMCTTQPSCSVLDPARTTSGPSSIGLARIGPRMPAGNFAAADHVRPASADVRAIPHHSDGLGPTL